MADQTVVNACVTSLLSGRPCVFTSEAGLFAVAVDGHPMPYRLFVVMLLDVIHNAKMLTVRTREDFILNDIKGEYASLTKGIKLPDRHQSSGNVLMNCWAAVAHMWQATAGQDDGSKECLLDTLHGIETDYAALVAD